MDDELKNTLASICCLLTPPGRGAVAVIAVAGADTEAVLDRFFESASNFRLTENPSRKIFYGHWRPTGEDILITRASTKRFEIHCHGGQAAPDSILETLSAAGFVKISSEEMASRLHDSGWKSETAIALSKAITPRIASLMLRQYQMADETWRRWSDGTSTDSESVVPELKRSLSWAAWGIDLARPRSVVFCGQPNVGKSSLVNAMLGFARSIVDAVAGTTRDVISAVSAIDGWPVELKDTAGLRDTAGEIESIGIGFARQEIRDADLVIAVLDASDCRESVDPHIQKLTNEFGREPAIVVRNKIDLISPAEFSAGNQLNFPVIDTSTVTGQGIETLLAAIADKLVPELPPSDLLIPLTTAQEAELRRVLDLK